MAEYLPGYEDHRFDYVLLKTYTPDFSFRDPKTKEIFFIEAKGRFPGSDRTKLLEVREQNPGVDIRLLFMQDNWISSNKKARYSDWAKKHDFRYSVWPKLPL